MFFPPSLFVCFSTFSYPAQEVSAWPGHLREPWQQGAISNRIPSSNSERRWGRSRRDGRRKIGKNKGWSWWVFDPGMRKGNKKVGAHQRNAQKKMGGRKDNVWEGEKERKIDTTGCLFKILHVKSWHILFNYETVWTTSLVSLGWSQYALLWPNKFEYVYV